MLVKARVVAKGFLFVSLRKGEKSLLLLIRMLGILNLHGGKIDVSPFFRLKRERN